MSATTEGQRLIDYFVVCGLDNVSGLEPDQLLGDSLHVPPVERSYKAKTLAHYPENVPWNPFDEHAVCMLSLPNGLQFKLNTETHAPSFHSFLITREDGSRMNGFALTFYEKVKDYEICKAMQILQDMFLAEQALNSHSAKSRSHSAVLYKERVEGLQHYLQNHPQSPTPEIKFYDSEKHNLLVSKCLCLVMPLPFTNAAKTCLSKIYQGGLTEEDLSLTLECYLYNLIYEVPLPPPGKKMKFTCITEDVLCQRPGVNELPLFDYSLEDVFALVGVKDFLKLLSCVMLEHQILILGSDFYTFMLVSESVTSLIFPFNWQHVYVPILPASLLHFLEAPVPFVMGLYCNNSDDVDAFLPPKSSLCCLDLNSRVLTVPDELPKLPYAEELAQELSEVLAKYEKKTNGPPPSTGRSSPSRIPRKTSNGPLPGRSSPSQIPRKKSLDVRLTAGKPFKKIDPRKAGSNQLRPSRSMTNLEKVAERTGIQPNLPAEGKEIPKEEREVENNHVEEAFKGLGPKDLRQLAFNVEIREILVNWFTQVFLDYGRFVRHPEDDQDMEQWLQNREQMENFDKAAFLSDQPASFLPFLAPFIETQMFASFIDLKLIEKWTELDPKLAVFDQRISNMKIVRSHSYERCQSIKSALQIVSRRSNCIDHTAPPPHVLDVEIRRGFGDGFFPDLIDEALVLDKVDSGRLKPKVNWRRKDRQKQHTEHLLLNANMKQEGKKMREKFLANIKKHIQENKTTKNPKSQLGDMSLNSSDAHINFIQQLLNECRGKTKRMLVLKMGQEAKDLGHNDVKGVEENSLIAALCDLLDRIWGHGLNKGKAKSPLWFHLLSYYNSCDGDTLELTEDSIGSPFQRSADSSPVIPRRQHIRRSTSPEPTRIRTESPARRQTKTLMADVRSVKNLSEMKTDTGCLRAFVRLALEKKALSKHLRTLLSDKDILRKHYKNYAFVRTEEEREQFLFYLLSLNAVDYFCFTNCFTTLAITYKVVIVTGKQLGGSTTTANVWMILAGEIKDTGTIDVPKGECEFRFQHPNVGKLTTLRIGHDNSGYAPGWFVEHVSVRNEITGHLYRFPCGRWLAKSNDDGSTERLLVAELQQRQTNNNEESLSSTSSSPQRSSPVLPRKTPEKSTIPEVQENVANAVNNIVKYFCSPESTSEKGYLTYLLCGENGLCDSLDQVFQCGFKSARLFQKNFFIWDFIEKVYYYLSSEEGSFILTDHRRAKLSFCSVVQKINDASQTVGKDGKFQTFICLGARDHLLEEWFPLISVCPVTAHMYEQSSFLRDKDMIQFLVDVLRALVEFNIVLEASLLKGIS